MKLTLSMLLSGGLLFAQPEVREDRRVVFRLLAPKAEAVLLRGGDMPGNGQGVPMVKDDKGIWEATAGPLPAGAYRYRFDVGGLNVVDPKNPAVSESNDNVWSLVTVPGSEIFDTKQTPHGAVAAVTYYSTSLKRPRRMHVYTPPGYEAGRDKYPVFYLLHGSSDSDDSWGSVGRAGVVLDNLIAAGKAKPMIMVMPAGHTRSGGMVAAGTPDEFLNDFSQDIMPYVEKNYRTMAERSHRALAGLSMGGGHTLTIGLPHLDRFAYLGVFSAGLFQMFPPAGRPVPPGPNFEEKNMAVLDDAKLKKGLKLFWFKIGKEDFLLESSRKTVAMLKTHGFEIVSEESAGGHTWLNWRDYLGEFAPMLFR